jgi:hypothetical protein
MERRIATRLVPVGLAAVLAAGGLAGTADAKVPAPNSLQLTQAF